MQHVRLLLLTATCAGLPGQWHGQEVARAAAEAELAGERSDTDALARLAASVDPDPWLVADELRLRGRGDVALRFAAEVPGATGAALVAFLDERRGHPVSGQVRECLRLARTAGPQDAADQLANVPTEAATRDPFDVALTGLARAILARKAGRADSVSDFESAAEAAGRIGWLGGQARALREAGLCAIARPDGLPQAVSLWQQSADLEAARGSRALEGRTLSFLGNAHGELGDYSSALRCMRRAAELIDPTGSPSLLVNVLANTAVVQERLGRPSRALACYERALELSRTAEGPRDTAAILIALASCQLDLGNPERSLKLAHEGLDRLTGAPDQGLAAQAHGTIGLAHEQLGDYEASLAALRTAHAAYVALDDQKAATTAECNLALVEMRLGHLDLAEDLQDRALASARAQADPWLEAAGLFHLSRIHRAQHRFDEARALDEQLLAIGERLSSAGLLLRAHLNAAGLAFERQQYRTAIDEVHEAGRHHRLLVAGLATGQDARARDARSEVFELGVRAAIELDDPTEFCWMIESGRAGALLEALGGRDTIEAACVPADLLLAKDAAVEAEFAAAQQLRAAVAADDRSAIAQLEAALAERRSAVRTAAGRIERSVKAAGDPIGGEPAALATIQHHLRSDEAFVAYSVGNPRAAALIATRSGARVVSLGAASAATARCLEFGGDPGLVRGPGSGRPARHAEPDAELAALRTELIESLHLDESVRRVLVSPDGPIAGVPFALLAPEIEWVYVPSGTTWCLLKEQRRDRGDGVLALGAPDYADDPTLPHLPGSEAEATRIGSEVLLADQATEPNLREHLRRSTRWRALHVACHARVDTSQPLESTLFLSPSAHDDGRLTVLDVLSLRVDADLVVLSACDTGRGRLYRSEGMVGFTRAFLTGGAGAVLVSLWQVDDAATQALMVRFHELWNPTSGRGMSAAAALKQAQEYVRRRPGWNAPHYWAAWQLWGLPE